MRIHDVLGIGFGPSNIALAIALEEIGSEIKAHFIERGKDSRWQPNMLLRRSDIQNNPLRDLVTPRNPRSRYSFTNYLHEKGRLLEYLNLGISYPLRTEYSQYVEWVADHFRSSVTYGCGALDIKIERAEDAGSTIWRVHTQSGAYTARNLILGTGRSVNIPAQFKDHVGARVFHLTDYKSRIDALAKRGLRSIAVIGASQSAVEIILDLIDRFPEASIHSVYRSFSVRQKDTSPFSDHVFLPEFIEYYFHLSEDSKADLRRQLRQTNYGAADLDVIHQLYVRLYEERIEGLNRFHRHNNTVVRSVRSSSESVKLELEERHISSQSGVQVDAVVLATGFRDVGSAENCDPCPPLLQGILSELETDGLGGIVVQRNYEVKAVQGSGLYLNGLCENSHGMGDAGSFSLLSIRANEIARSIISRLNPREEKVGDHKDRQFRGISDVVANGERYAILPQLGLNSMMTLTIGSRSYSSWSMRPWLVAQQADIPLNLNVIPFNCEGTTRALGPSTRTALAEASPSSLVPVLETEGGEIWDSLAICEFFAEAFPDRNLWPRDSRERATARSITAEMHSGFSNLRGYLPFYPRGQVSKPIHDSLPDEVRLDVRRIESIWTECRGKFKDRGPFLFGTFSITDAMFAPVVIRFWTYRLPLSKAAEEYSQTILSLPATRKWIEDARSEAERIIPIEDLVNDFPAHVARFRETEIAGRTIQ